MHKYHWGVMMVYLRHYHYLQLTTVSFFFPVFIIPEKSHITLTSLSSFTLKPCLPMIQPAWLWWTIILSSDSESPDLLLTCTESTWKYSINISTLYFTGFLILTYFQQMSKTLCSCLLSTISHFFIWNWNYKCPLFLSALYLLLHFIPNLLIFCLLLFS